MDMLGAPAILRQKFEASADVEVWPENWLAVRVFSLMSTQWRVGMGGVTGMDYAALPFVLKRSGCRRKKIDDTFWAVREMELEVLNIVSERNG